MNDTQIGTLSPTPYFVSTIFTESCENESSNNHENCLHKIGPDDGRKAACNGKETSDCLEKKRKPWYSADKDDCRLG
jgi:hypothetical protein